jgi:hypothetical protein
MTVFVDTSALYAVLDADDDNHPPAAAEWRRLLLSASTVVPPTMSWSRQRRCCSTAWGWKLSAATSAVRRNGGRARTEFAPDSTS